MTVEVERPEREPHERRHIWLFIGIGFALVIATTITLYLIAVSTLDTRYAPLRERFVGSSGSNIVDDPPHLLGRTGARSYIDIELQNHGSHPVQIDRIDLDDVLVAAQWSTRRTTATTTTWHDFGARIRANANIQVRLTLRTPDCSRPPRRATIGSATFRWHALGHTHRTRLPLGHAYAIC